MSGTVYDPSLPEEDILPLSSHIWIATPSDLSVSWYPRPVNEIHTFMNEASSQMYHCSGYPAEYDKSIELLQQPCTMVRSHSLNMVREQLLK